MASARAKTQDELGIPPGLQFFTPFPFAGLNQTAGRTGIKDQEWFYIENWIKVGEGNLRTLWDKGEALYTAPAGQTILSAFFFNIAATQYVAIFFTDGTAIQVNAATGATKTISSTAGAFYVGDNGPGCIQWGTQYLIIGNNFAENCYFVWDGSVLYQAGTISPQVTLLGAGSGYSSAPTVQVVGGKGSGAAITAYVENGSVVQFVVTNPGSGYGVNDNPVVVISGGGSDSAPLLQAYLGSDTLTGVIITGGGSGYTSAPTVTFGSPPAGGTTATGTATIASGAVVGVTITNPGSGYVAAPNVVFSGGGGSGASATSVLASGYIQSINVTQGGSGFTSAPTLTFSGGGGTGAAATANLTGTSVSQVYVTNGGSGYASTPTVTISAPSTSGGVTATAVCGVVGGTITSFTVTNAGSGYTAPPAVTISGGGGTGATATAALVPTSIGSVTITNPGNGYSDAPAVIVAAGYNRAAYASVNLMPYGVSGTALEAFQSRVWIANQWTNPALPPSDNNSNQFSVSAPGSFSNFATSAGGVQYTATDRFLRVGYTAMRQTNGYLYPLGDCSVSIISGVSTSGNPSTTTFNYQNTDPQVGTPWRDSCQDFGRTVLFANALGVYGLYGGAVTKVSPQLDQLFAAAVFPPTPGALSPSAATANIFGGKYYLLLMTLRDPLTLKLVNKMLVWDERQWVVASQSVALKFICTQEVNSNLTAWGSDGSALYPLFQTPSADIASTLYSKLYGSQTPHLLKKVYSVKVQGQNLQTLGGTMNVAISLQTETGAYEVNEGAPITFGVTTGYNQAYPLFKYGLPDGSGVAGIFLGFTVITTTPDMTLNYLALGYTMEAYTPIGSLNLTVSGLEEEDV